MKLRTNLFTALALTIAGTHLAQAQIGIGIQGGYLSTKAKIENKVDNTDDVSDAVTGYTVGIPIEISLGEAFAIQPEINYLRRGYNSFGSGNNKVETFYNVLEIPLLAKLGYVSDNFSLAAVLGPSFQYTMSGQTKGTLLGVDFNEKIKGDDFDSGDINRSNFFGIGGLQLGVPIGIGKFVVDGRYRFQLNDENGGDDINVRGRGVSATAGLIFTLGDY